MASDVWSHSIDTGSLDTVTIPNPSLEPTNMERGASDFDIRNSFQTGVNYSVPYSKTNPVAAAILGHGVRTLSTAREAPRP